MGVVEAENLQIEGRV